MMRKNIKTGLIAFGMCLALPFCSFAAVKNPEKAEGREERAQIRTELACGSHSHFLLNFYTPGPASSAPLPEFCPGASKAALVSAAVGAFEVPGPLVDDPGPADGPGPALV